MMSGNYPPVPIDYSDKPLNGSWLAILDYADEGLPDGKTSTWEVKFYSHGRPDTGSPRDGFAYEPLRPLIRRMIAWEA